MSASVKIMLSYDFCHFEISKSTDEDISDKQINEMRKDCQRLTDEAVRQYKIAKDNAAKRVDGEMKIRNFESECLIIKRKSEQDRTLKEIGMLKEYEDENWKQKFITRWDYEDDEETFNF